MTDVRLFIFKVKDWGVGWCFFSPLAVYVNSVLEPYRVIQRITIDTLILREVGYVSL